MVTVGRFAEAVLPHGTTTVLIDNHEIANVLGLEASAGCSRRAARCRSRCCSRSRRACRPCRLRGRRRGHRPDDIREALGWEGVGGLGEMMNMPGVIESDDATHAMIGAMLDAGCRSTGTGACTAGTTIASRLRRGGRRLRPRDRAAQRRAGQAARGDVGAAARVLRVARRREARPVPLEDGVDSRHALLVTDDMHHGLATVGISPRLRTAIARGIDR